MRTATYVLVAGVICSFCCGPARAQFVAGTGSISGVVRDVTGGAVPGALIEAVNASKAIRRSAKTDFGGIFSVPALPPANGYVITVMKEGQEAGSVDFDITQ